MSATIIPQNECKHESFLRIGRANLIRCTKCGKIMYKDFEKRAPEHTVATTSPGAL